MVFQQLILPTENEYPNLYYRGDIILSDTDIVSFDTYYNSFSYTKYRDYTNVKDVTFTCTVNGEVLVQLCVFDGCEHIVGTTQGNGKLSVSAKLSELPESGFLYPKITALSEAEFLRGEYTSEIRGQDINVCIAICTYKREEYVLENIEQLKNSKFSCIKHIFVIDNGNTLDCAALSDDFISVLPNKNYGGSGGFTRGLIEAYDGKYSHVILMDDDVKFHSETLEQMTVFMSLLSEEYKDSWFSAGMMTLDKPWEQFEFGAIWDGRIISLKHKVDVREHAVLLDNLNNPGANYGAWWCLCMPVSIVERNGLPLPVFIKCDDIEYGLRKPEGTEIITLNGIAVCHEAFENKFNFIVDYYYFRNEMVTIALYKKNGMSLAIKRFIFEIGCNMTRFRYDNIPVVFRAVEQFLGGVDFFLNCDEEQNNKDINSSLIKLVPLDTIPGYSEDMKREFLSSDMTSWRILNITLGGHLMPAFMLKKELNAIPMSQLNGAAMYRRKAVIQYQLNGNNGVLLERDFFKFLKYGFKTVGMIIKLFFRYKKVARDYNSRIGEITSQEFWRKHLGIK